MHYTVKVGGEAIAYTLNETAAIELANAIGPSAKVYRSTSNYPIRTAPRSRAAARFVLSAVAAGVLVGLTLAALSALPWAPHLFP